MTTQAALAELCSAQDKITSVTLHAEQGDTSLIVAMERDAAMAVYQAYACSPTIQTIASPAYMRALLVRMADHLENANNMPAVTWGMRAMLLINEVRALQPARLHKITEPVPHPEPPPAIGGTD